MTNAETIYQYPLAFRRVTATLWIFVLAFNLIEYVLAWARAIYGLSLTPLQLPRIDFLTPTASIVIMLLTAHLGLFAALIVAYAIPFLTPRIALYETGMIMTTALGKQWIPFTALVRIHSTELHANGRFVVWVESTRGLPLQGLVASLLLGRWSRRGFLLTSDLPGFDNLIAYLIEQLKQKYGEAKFAAHFSEELPTWQLQMLNAPRATMRQVAAEEYLPIEQKQATRQMISVAASLALPMLVGAIIHLQFPLGAIVLPLVALLEYPLASLYLTVLPIETSRRMELGDALRVYPLTQLPRWVVAIGLTLLVLAGVPPILMIVIPIPAIAVGCIGVIALTEEWFIVHPPDSWLGALVTIICQLVLYEMFVWLLPR